MMGAKALTVSTIFHWITGAISVVVIVITLGDYVARSLERACARLEQLFERLGKLADAFGRAGLAWQRLRRRSQAAWATWCSKRQPSEDDVKPPVDPAKPDDH